MLNGIYPNSKAECNSNRTEITLSTTLWNQILNARRLYVPTDTKFRKWSEILAICEQKITLLCRLGTTNDTLFNIAKYIFIKWHYNIQRLALKSVWFLIRLFTGSSIFLNLNFSTTPARVSILIRVAVEMKEKVYSSMWQTDIKVVISIFSHLYPRFVYIF